MRKKRLLAFIAVSMIAVATVAETPPLAKLGQPFVNTNCEIIWKTATNGWPASLWVYRVLPSNFSQAVISKLKELGSFTDNDKVANLGWQHGDHRSLVFFQR